MWGPAALAAGPKTPSANASAPTTSEATSPAATSTAERLFTIPFLSPTACCPSSTGRSPELKRTAAKVRLRAGKGSAAEVEADAGRRSVRPGPDLDLGAARTGAEVEGTAHPRGSDPRTLANRADRLRTTVGSERPSTGQRTVKGRPGRHGPSAGGGRASAPRWPSCRACSARSV